MYEFLEYRMQIARIFISKKVEIIGFFTLKRFGCVNELSIIVPKPLFYRGDFMEI